MNPIELFVQRVFAERYGIELQKIDEPQDRKVPDFELVRAGKRVAVVEVKNLEAVDPNVTPGWSPDGVFHTRLDNGPGRVANCIHNAYAQLNGYSEPKVLVLVSDGDVNVGDLDEAFRGYMDYGEGNSKLRNTASRRIAEGRIRDEKTKIDLYAWMNRDLFRKPFIIEFPLLQAPREKVIKDEDLVQFRTITPRGRAILKEVFGLDSE